MDFIFARAADKWMFLIPLGYLKSLCLGCQHGWADRYCSLARLSGAITLQKREGKRFQRGCKLQKGVARLASSLEWIWRWREDGLGVLIHGRGGHLGLISSPPPPYPIGMTDERFNNDCSQSISYNYVAIKGYIRVGRMVVLLDAQWNFTRSSFQPMGSLVGWTHESRERLRSGPVNLDGIESD